MEKQMKLFSNMTKPFVLFVLLFALGVGQMWAGTYLKGSFDSWGGGSEFVDGVATLEVKKVDSYQFKILNNDSDDKWTGAGSSDGEKSITSASTSVTLNAQGSGSNVGFVADVVGTYIFTLSGSTLTVTYPTARTYNSGQKIYLKDVASQVNWCSGGNAYWGQYGNVYAYFSGDESSWSAAATVASGSSGAANAIYEITVPGTGKKFTSVCFARGSNTSSIWQRTTDQSSAVGYNCFYISSDADDGCKYKGSWGRYAKNPSIIGNFNNWDPDQGFFTDGRIILDLEASTDYTFKVLVNEAYCGVGLSAGTITNTLSDWWKLDDSYNVALTSGEEGEYCFHWDAVNYKLFVYYPQARLAKSTYLYFDGRNSTQAWGTYSWGARYFYKYYDSGSDLESGGTLDCTTPLEGYVHYTIVPNNDYVGQIQVERKDPSNMDGTRWNYAAVCSAKDRDNTAQNCMYIDDDHKTWDDNFVPAWTTYCPIKATSSINDNGTVKTWGGSGTSGSPYYVAAGSKIKVSAASTDHISDANMTTKYDFQVRNASDVQQAHSDGTGTTYEYTVPATNDVVYKVRVNSYNYYNSTSSTAKWSSDIYYKARTPYTISYNKGTYGTGSRDSETKLKEVDFTLPNSAVFTRDHYTQTGWTTSDGDPQTHALGGSYTSDAAQEFFPVWTEDPYTVTTSSGEGGSVDEDSYTAYVATTTAISATPAAGYMFSHWSVESGSATFADQYSASTTMNATSDAEIKANFLYRWSIAGTWKYYPDSDTEDADAYTMGNIGRNASSKDTCYVEITLAANTNYTFQVVDRSTSPYTWHKNSNDESAPFYMTYGNSTAWGFASDKTKACGITTAGAGTYKFAYNITDGTVTVTYPTSYTVTYGWTAGMPETSVSASVGGNALSSGGYAAAGSDVTFTETHPTGFTFNGWYTTQDGNTPVSGMSTSDNVLDNIGANATVYAKYTENHFDVTAAASPATGGTVTPTSATSFGQYYGGDISATPYIGYCFTGWTGGTGSFVDASLMSTKFKPTATSTVTAGFSRRYAFIEGNFQIYDQARSAQTKTGNAFTDESTAIPMEWDDTNHRFYLHTYSTPAELAANLNNAAAWFYIMTSAENNALSTTCAYKSSSGTNQNLAAAGAANKKSAGYDQTQSFHFTGSDDAYVIIYFDGNYIWYELEAALLYNGNTGTGDAPAARTYYAYGSNQTAAANTYSKTGYSFDHWDTAADDSGSDYAAGATNVAMNAREVCLHAQWTINNHDITYTAPSNGSYTIKAGDASAVSENVDDVDYSTTVTLAATPASGYSFSSWSLTGATAADASSANTTFSMPDNDVTVEASFTEDKHTVTVEIGSAGGGVFSYGGSSSLTTKEISGIGISTATGDIVVDSLNPAWRFKKWEYDGAKITITTGGYTSKTIRVNATADATITAVFEPRFGLIGSLNEDGDPAGGMPNKDGETWGNVRSEDYEADFEVISFTAVGTGEGTGVDLRCTRTLESNKQYKFQIVDRATVGRDRFCLAAGGSTLLEANESITLTYKEQSNANVLINTIGYGDYTFRITNIAATTYNPTVTVDRPTDSKQLTLKCGYSIDAASAVTLGTAGGTAMGHTDEGGDGFDISDGGFFKSGSHITFTATPATGYVFEGWYTDNTYGTRFATDNPMTMTEGTNANVTVYARFIEKTNTFTDGASTGYWNNTSNWSLGSLPTINERVVITKPVTVDTAYATAKRIILDQSSSNTGKLTVQANKGLEVQQTIQVYNGSSYGPTTEEDLVLESSSAGNASLIFNNSNACQATVQMYSKASISGDTWNWQYVGTPFTGSIPLYNYYGSWMYKWDGGWQVVTGSETLDPFTGYCLTQSSATTHVMGGTLVPTTSKTVSMAATTDMVLANSWTAPISIASFDIEGGDATFTSTPATIYLFNTGMAENGSNEGTEAGTYISVPINSAPYTGNGLIAPMQGFFVTTNGGSSGTITMNYDALVRPSGSHTDIVAGPMKMRKQEETKPDVMKIRVDGATYYDRVVILERADFSEGFDNGWDGEKMSFGVAAPSVYVINGQGGYDAVSAIPDLEGTVVGFRAGTNNSCTMTFEYDGEEIWYLNDLQTQQSTLIDSELTYTFSTSSYDNEARFIISATPIRKITTGNESVGAEAAKVRKLIINDKLYIIRGGRMYSVDGAMIK